VGHKITSDSGGGDTGDSADEWIVRKQECIALRAKLSATDAKALDTAIHASNFKDIGTRSNSLKRLRSGRENASYWQLAKIFRL